MDESDKPPPGARQEVNAHMFLQQVALVMSYAGVSLFGRSESVSDSVKQVVNPIINSKSICRDPCLRR